MQQRHLEFLGDAGQMLVWAFVLVVAGKVYLGSGSQAALSFASFVGIGWLLGRHSKFKKLCASHESLRETQDQLISVLENRVSLQQIQIRNLSAPRVPDGER
jgi:hypothetical protein